ncbi:Early nodulin-like protein 9 [Asimina triloba]
MARLVFRSSGPQAMAFYALGLFVFAMLVQRSGAHEFKVGGSSGWTVPRDQRSMTYNQWAEMNRFQIGDSLLFVYQPDKDSVLQVSKGDYDNCNTASPITLFHDGNTSFKFNQSGPYYFISGVGDNCRNNEKLIVVVMADRSKNTNTNQTNSQSPSGPSTPPPSGANINVISLMASVGMLLWYEVNPNFIKWRPYYSAWDRKNVSGSEPGHSVEL